MGTASSTHSLFMLPEPGSGENEGSFRVFLDSADFKVAVLGFAGADQRGKLFICSYGQDFPQPQNGKKSKIICHIVLDFHIKMTYIVE